MLGNRKNHYRALLQGNRKRLGKNEMGIENNYAALQSLKSLRNR